MSGDVKPLDPKGIQANFQASSLKACFLIKILKIGIT